METILFQVGEWQLFFMSTIWRLQHSNLWNPNWLYKEIIGPCNLMFLVLLWGLVERKKQNSREFVTSSNILDSVVKGNLCLRGTSSSLFSTLPSSLLSLLVLSLIDFLAETTDFECEVRRALLPMHFYSQYLSAKKIPPSSLALGDLSDINKFPQFSACPIWAKRH